MTTLEKILKRKAEIMTILESYEDIPEEEFEETEFAKNKEHFKLFAELEKLTKEETKLIRQN